MLGGEVDCAFLQFDRLVETTGFGVGCGKRAEQRRFASGGEMLTTSAVYDNLQGMAKELQAQGKEFRENPRKFLRMKLF